MKGHSIRRSTLMLATLLLLPLGLGAQDVSVLVQAVENEPGLQVSSEVVREEDEALSSVFGSDLEAAEDFGVIGVSEFSVDDPTGNSAVRLYEMIDSAAAFGWFAYKRDYEERGYEPLALGAEAYTDSGTIAFWQSRFVVQVSGLEENSLEVARVISNAITGPSRKPPVSALLPGTGRVLDSERYLLTPSSIEALDIDPDSLGFENSVEAATATYRNESASVQLALFLYPTPQLARIHSEAWLASSSAGRLARRSGLVFGIITESNSDSLAQAVLSELRTQFDVTWNEPPPDPLTIQRIILTAFAWTGLVCLFTLTAGMGFGGLRIYLRRRHQAGAPGSAFDTDFLQLNINKGVNEPEAVD